MNLIDTIEPEIHEGKIAIEPSYLDYLRSHGYVLEDVKNVQVIPSNSRDAAHIVCEVETYDYPQGHDKLDIAADSLSIKICSCEDYQHNQSVDVSERPLKEASAGSCKHLKSAYRAEKAKADDAQDTL